MFRTVKIGIVLLVLFVPLIGYSKHLNSDLLSAAERGDITTLKALIAKGADVNAKDKAGRTALMYAVGKGHTKIVETLMAKGADVNVKDKDGSTALMVAAMSGHIKIIRLLKQAAAKE